MSKSTLKGLAVIAAITILLRIGLEIESPGVNGDALDISPVSPILGHSSGLLLLIIFRSLHTFAESKRPGSGRLSIAMYLLASAMFSYMAWNSLIETYATHIEVISDPGQGAMLLFVLTSVAGAAILWWAAEQIARTGLVNGTLWTVGVFGALSWWYYGLAVGADIGLGNPPIGAVSLGATAVSMCALATVAAFCLPSEWPLRLISQLSLTGPVDAWLLPLSVVMVAQEGVWFLVLFSGVVALPLWVYSILPPLAACASALVLSLILISSRERAQPLWLLLAPIAPLYAVAAVLVGIFTLPGGFSSLWQPGPFDGEVSAQVVLVGEEAGPDDPARILGRLLELGVNAEMEVDENRIIIDFHKISSVNAVLDPILKPGLLTLHRVHSEDAPDALVLQDCQSKEDPCAEMSVYPAFIDGHDITAARVVYGDFEDSVQVAFSDEAAKRLLQVTTDNVGQPLAIARDGEVLIAPIIREPIPGGMVHISMGSHDSTPGDLEALAASLRAAGPRGRWTISEVR